MQFLFIFLAVVAMLGFTSMIFCLDDIPFCQEAKVQTSARNSNLRYCFARCIGLISSDSNSSTRSPCTFNSNTGKAIETNEARKFKPAANNNKMVLCYYQMLQKTSSPANMTALDAINLNLCTHVAVQDFAELVSSDNITFSVQQRNDLLPGSENDIKQMLAMGGIKVMLSLGGTDVEPNRKYSMLANSTQRSEFVTNVFQFIKQYQFHGLDVFWMFPSCWGYDCNQGKQEDKGNFANLIQELSDYMKPRHLLLSTILSASVVRQAGYDVVKLSEALDWFCAMTYSFHGHWDVPKVVAHNSPMFEFQDALNYLVMMKVDPLKVVAAIPIFAQTFTLLDKNLTKAGSKFKGPGKLGHLSKIKGQLYYSELCYLIQRDEWTTQQNKNEKQVSTYSFKDDQWISFEEVFSIRAKMQYLSAKGFAGAMAYSINMDDFTGQCGCGRFPLLRAINVVLRGSLMKMDDCIKPQA